MENTMDVPNRCIRTVIDLPLASYGTVVIDCEARKANAENENSQSFVSCTTNFAAALEEKMENELLGDDFPILDEMITLPDNHDTSDDLEKELLGDCDDIPDTNPLPTLTKSTTEENGTPFDIDRLCAPGEEGDANTLAMKLENELKEVSGTDNKENISNNPKDLKMPVTLDEKNDSGDDQFFDAVSASPADKPSEKLAENADIGEILPDEVTVKSQNSATTEKLPHISDIGSLFSENAEIESSETSGTKNTPFRQNGFSESSSTIGEMGSKIEILTAVETETLKIVDEGERPPENCDLESPVNVFESSAVANIPDEPEIDAEMVSKPEILTSIETESLKIVDGEEIPSEKSDVPVSVNVFDSSAVASIPDEPEIDAKMGSKTEILTSVETESLKIVDGEERSSENDLEIPVNVFETSAVATIPDEPVITSEQTEMEVSDVAMQTAVEEVHSMVEGGILEKTSELYEPLLAETNGSRFNKPEVIDSSLNAAVTFGPVENAETYPISDEEESTERITSEAMDVDYIPKEAIDDDIHINPTPEGKDSAENMSWDLNVENGVEPEKNEKIISVSHQLILELEGISVKNDDSVEEKSAIIEKIDAELATNLCQSSDTKDTVLNFSGETEISAEPATTADLIQGIMEDILAGVKIEEDELLEEMEVDLAAEIDICRLSQTESSGKNLSDDTEMGYAVEAEKCHEELNSSATDIIDGVLEEILGRVQIAEKYQEVSMFVTNVNAELGAKTEPSESDSNDTSGEPATTADLIQGVMEDILADVKIDEDEFLEEMNVDLAAETDVCRLSQSESSGKNLLEDTEMSYAVEEVPSEKCHKKLNSSTTDVIEGVLEEILGRVPIAEKDQEVSMFVTNVDAELEAKTEPFESDLNDTSGDTEMLVEEIEPENLSNKPGCVPTSDIIEEIAEEVLNNVKIEEELEEKSIEAAVSSADVVKEIIDAVLDDVSIDDSYEEQPPTEDFGTEEKLEDEIVCQASDLEKTSKDPELSDLKMEVDSEVDLIKEIIEEILENVFEESKVGDKIAQEDLATSLSGPEAEISMEEESEVVESSFTVGAIRHDLVASAVPSGDEDDILEPVKDEELAETIAIVNNFCEALVKPNTKEEYSLDKFLDETYDDNSSLEGRQIASFILEGIVDKIFTYDDSSDDDHDFLPENEIYSDDATTEKPEPEPDYGHELFEEILTDVIRNNDKEVIMSEIIEDLIGQAVPPKNYDMPIVVIKAATISPEYFKRLKRAAPEESPEGTPVKQLRSRRTTNEELDMSLVIKEEVVDMPYDAEAVDETEDIKPELPSPEALIGRTRSGQVLPPIKNKGRPRKKTWAEPKNATGLKRGRPRKVLATSGPPPSEELPPKKAPKNAWKAQLKEKPAEKLRHLPERNRQPPKKRSPPRGRLRPAVSPPTPPPPKRRVVSPPPPPKRRVASPPPPPKRRVASPPPPPKRRQPSPQPASKRRTAAASPPPASKRRTVSPSPAPKHRRASPVPLPTRTSRHRASPPPPKAKATPVPVSTRARKSSPGQSTPPVEESPFKTKKRASMVEVAAPAPASKKARKSAPVFKNFAVKSTTPITVISPPRKPRKQDFKKADPEPDGWADLTWQLDSISSGGLKKPSESVSEADKRPKSSPLGISVRPCHVRLERCAFIDRLLPKHKEGGIFCELCEPKRLFLTKDGLVHHMKNEHAGTFGPTQSSLGAAVVGDRCPGCNKKFRSHNRLVGHIQTCPAVSSNSPQQMTQIPNGSFSGRAVEQDQRFTCVCGEKFTHWPALEAHKRSHWGEKVGDPLDLETEGSSQGTYESEIQRRGTGLKMLIRRERLEFVKCSYCGAPFDNPETLKMHELTHISKVKVKRERESPELEILEEYLAPTINLPQPPPKHCVPVSAYEPPYTAPRDPEHSIWESYNTSASPRRPAEPRPQTWTPAGHLSTRQPRNPEFTPMDPLVSQVSHGIPVTKDISAYGARKGVVSIPNRTKTTTRPVPDVVKGWEDVRNAAGVKSWHSPQPNETPVEPKWGSSSKRPHVEVAPKEVPEKCVQFKWGSSSKRPHVEDAPKVVPEKCVEAIHWEVKKRRITPTARKSTGGGPRPGPSTASATQATAKKSTGGKPASRFPTASVRRGPFLSFHK